MELSILLASPQPRMEAFHKGSFDGLHLERVRYTVTRSTHSGRSWMADVRSRASCPRSGTTRTRVFLLIQRFMFNFQRILGLGSRDRGMLNRYVQGLSRGEVRPYGSRSTRTVNDFGLAQAACQPRPTFLAWRGGSYGLSYPLWGINFYVLLRTPLEIGPWVNTFLVIRCQNMSPKLFYN